jgi:hypothetical protein
MNDNGLKKYGYDVINVECIQSVGVSTQVALEARQALTDGKLKTTSIPPLKMEFKSRALSGAIVVPIAVITHVENGKSGRFNGFVVGEEYSGPKSNHPLLLIPPGQVKKRT